MATKQPLPNKTVKSKMNATVVKNPPAERGREINRPATAMPGPSAKVVPHHLGADFIGGLANNCFEWN
jgi:hypothetical protein